MTAELIKLETGIDMVHVPHKGMAGAMVDLLGGHVQAMVTAMQTVAPQVRANKLRMLAVMSAKRSQAMPGVPTMIEQGMPSLVVETWYGLFAPAATPPAIVGKLNADVNALLQLPDTRDALARQGMNVVGGGGEAFGGLVKQELARWARVVTAAKIRAN